MNIIDNQNQLMNEILDLDNILLAVKQVKSNKGSAGVDNMSIKDMIAYVNSKEFPKLLESIRKGEYKPSPVKMVEIPKPDGGVRMLGIPTVIDRVIQQAISQILTKIYDSQFSEYSYGFRPNRGAHDALVQAERYVGDESIYVVDIDLSKFFDTINKDKMMSLLQKEIKDKSVLRLINKYLQAGILKGSQLIKSQEGTPQGSPLSPLLSNIYLDQVDKELERRQIRFVRYADDIQIYARSIKSAYRIKENTIRLIEGNRIKLKVNEEKSAVKKLNEAKFLGYSFRREYGTEIIKLCLHKKSWDKFKTKIREILKRNRGISITQYISELRLYMRGWTNYFRLGLSKTQMLKTDGWIRRKLRTILWKQWKTTKMRVKMQRKYTMYKYTCSNSSKGMFYTAKHKLNSVLTNDIMKRVYGYEAIEDIYNKGIEKTKSSRYTQLSLGVI